MCSVVEANVANICTNIPTLGYQVFFDWYNNRIYGAINGETARGRTIGFSQGSGFPTEYPGQELDDIAEQHRPLRLRTIDSWGNMTRVGGWTEYEQNAIWYTVDDMKD